ncbi:MAG: TetR/AcrR family transcriptional regulator [Holophagales bacterium]|nr:TetR/AcrR family transcriptional regulator [Holophagales bacterium]
MLLFTNRGYAATSVREIVEMAGVTKPALYYHFDSKEGIYLAILDDLVKIADEGIAASRVASGTARERLEGFLLGIYGLFETKKSWVRMINAVFWGPAQGVPPFDFETFHTKLRFVISEIVGEGIAAGELRAADPDDVTLALMGVLSFNMDLDLAHPELGLGRDGFRRVLDLLFSGVAAPTLTSAH